MGAGPGPPTKAPAEHRPVAHCCGGEPALKMTPKHYKAALLMALGMSQVWIADKLSMTTAGVRKWTTDPEFQALVAEVTDAVISDTTAIMSDARRRAFAAATEIFESDSAKPSDRLDAIKLVLDRTGDAPKAGSGQAADLAAILAKVAG